VVLVDPTAYDRFAREEEGRRRGQPPFEPDAESERRRAQETRAIRHALAEYEIPVHTVIPERPLSELLVS
jgi:hypothetical protein